MALGLIYLAGLRSGISDDCSFFREHYGHDMVRRE